MVRNMNWGERIGGKIWAGVSGDGVKYGLG